MTLSPASSLGSGAKLINSLVPGYVCTQLSFSSFVSLKCVKSSSKAAVAAKICPWIPPFKHQIKGDQIINFISSATNKTKLVGERKNTGVICKPPSWNHQDILASLLDNCHQSRANCFDFLLFCFSYWSRYFRLLWISEEHSQDTTIPKSYPKYFSMCCRNVVQMSPNSANRRTACKIIKYSHHSTQTAALHNAHYITTA